MEWSEYDKGKEARFYRNPFKFFIFPDDDDALCVVWFGDSSASFTVQGKGEQTHLEAGKAWCMSWARQKIKELARDFQMGVFFKETGETDE